MLRSTLPILAPDATVVTMCRAALQHNFRRCTHGPKSKGQMSGFAVTEEPLTVLSVPGQVMTFKKFSEEGRCTRESYRSDSRQCGGTDPKRRLALTARTQRRQPEKGIARVWQTRAQAG